MLPLGLALACLPAARAADLTLLWDTNPVDDMVQQYRLYVATGPPFPAPAPIAPGTSSFIVTPTIGATQSFLFSGIATNNYRFWVTAINVWGESDPSNAVDHYMPSAVPAAPAGVSVVVTPSGERNGLWNVLVTWQPSPIEQGVLDYQVTMTNFPPGITSGTSWEFENIPPRRYEIFVTARNRLGIGAASPVVILPNGRPKVPQNVHLQAQ